MKISKTKSASITESIFPFRYVILSKVKWKKRKNERDKYGDREKEREWQMKIESYIERWKKIERGRGEEEE